MSAGCAQDALLPSIMRHLALLAALLALPLASTLTGCAEAQRAVQTATGGYEADTDRPGSDFRDFDAQMRGPASCDAACRADARCLAWTHTPPGAQSDGGHCWLKDAVPDALPLTGATSGLVRR